MTSEESPLLRGLVDIHNWRWWSRIWVLQESTVAKSAVFICSEHRSYYSDIVLWYSVVDRDSLRNAARRLYPEMGSARKHLDIWFLLRQAASSDGKVNSDILLLHKTRSLKASDLRDKVFGVLGLSNSLMALFPSPDYSRSPSDIFAEIAKAFLDGSRSLRILEEANSAEPASNHPSWVPDWSVYPISILPWRE